MKGRSRIEQDDLRSEYEFEYSTAVRGKYFRRLLKEGVIVMGQKNSRERGRVSSIIERMVRRIVERFDPERVILFGSRARGMDGPERDVDLLVVMPVQGSKREKQLEIRLALREFHIAKDIIVTTPEEFSWRKDIPGTVERPAVLEGKVLYARP